MGHRKVEQAALFYEFRWRGTFLLIIVELGDVRPELAAFYSTMAYQGRSSGW